MPRKKMIYSMFLFLAIITAFVYIGVRLYIYLSGNVLWYEKVIGGFLLASEILIMIHGIGYFFEILTVYYYRKKENEYPLTTKPFVAIIIPSYHEPIEILKNTLALCENISYPNKKIFLLDDTRYESMHDPKLQKYKKEVDRLCSYFKIGLFRHPWRGAKAGIINDFIFFIENKPQEGSSLHSCLIDPSLNFPYIVIFDADQNPMPDFLDQLIPTMEKNPKLALIQTPQYYSNFEKNEIARAAGLQQVIFYEFICEGKSIKDTMFCTGTNVIIRKKALLDVGGFDEKSITEDFAVSLEFHKKGWHTLYHNEITAFGMGPENLGGYFKQQFRWALGTLNLFKKVFSLFVHRPKSLKFQQWIEYFLSSSYYFIGTAYFILLVCPILFITLDIPSYFAKVQVYGIIFIPYFIFSLSSFYLTIKHRGYRMMDVLLGQLLIAVSFPIYMKAAFCALTGIKGKFEVTLKGRTEVLAWKKLWPQLLMISACWMAVIWGFLRIFFEREIVSALLVSIFWCFYNCLFISSIFYFNKEEKLHQNA
jgi:cellulose synthase (UDP-forming)